MCQIVFAFSAMSKQEVPPIVNKSSINIECKVTVKSKESHSKDLVTNTANGYFRYLGQEATQEYFYSTEQGTCLPLVYLTS